MEWGVTAGGSISFWSDENVLGLDSGDGCTTWCIYQKKALNYTLKRVNLMICELQCNNTHAYIRGINAGSDTPVW